MTISAAAVEELLSVSGIGVPAEEPARIARFAVIWYGLADRFRAGLEPTLNAFIRIDRAGALKAARALERALLRGRYRGPLHGIPITLKDLLDVRGHPTSAGSAQAEQCDCPADTDATVWRRLRHAGAVLIGKTNLDEFAMGATTDNPHVGCARNPWDPACVPGGSSGGSAIAVATGAGYASLGTDTGGSVRVPSALCNVTGFKPTFGSPPRSMSRRATSGFADASASSAASPVLNAPTTERVGSCVEGGAQQVSIQRLVFHNDEPDRVGGHGRVTPG